MSEPVFAQRALALVVGISVVSFVVGVLLAIFGQDLIGIDSYGSSSYSYSAIGHRALVETLEDLDIPVYTSTWNSARRAGRDGVLLLIEPNVVEQRQRGWGFDRERALRKRIEVARTTVLVLPKWTGREHESESGWLGDARLRPEWDAEAVLQGIDLQGISVVRPTSAPTTWNTGGFGPAPELRDVQLVQGPRLDPIVDCELGTLVGELRFPPKPGDEPGIPNRLVIVSDPDLLANHGMARPGNAILAVRLIDHLRLGGAVVVDETVHGYEFQPSIWRRAFTFPASLVSLQLVFCLCVLLWAGMGRFGSPRRPPPPLEPGNQFLIKNTAELLRVGGHAAEMLRRYLDDTVMLVRSRLHIPASIQGGALVATLDRISANRKVETPYSQVAAEVADVLERGARQPERVVRAARRVYEWRREILDGPGGG